MPISINRVEERRRTITVDLGDGDTFDVTYKPAVYTADFEAEIRNGAAEADQSLVGRMLERLIAEWDVYEDEAQKKRVPVTAERIKSLPMIVLLPVIEAINADIRPKPRTGGSFSDG